MITNKWIEELAVKPHSTANLVKFNEQYSKNTAVWDKVFSFIKENDLDQIEAGKYPLDEKKCFAIISEYDTKGKDESKIESHENYIDLQYVISGEEQIGLVPVEKTTVKIPYNNEKDVIIYDSEKVEYHLATNQSYFLFFPGEIHQPSVDANEKSHVKKLVIKIQNV